MEIDTGSLAFATDMTEELTVLLAFVSQLSRATMKSPCGTWRPATGD